MIRASLLLAPILATAFVTPARADNDPTDICPALIIDDSARTAAYYPGGEPGRNKKDFSHIAVILSAVATCVETDDDQILATVTITYAAESGPLYRGAAEVKIKAAVARGGAPISTAQNVKSTQLPQGQHTTVSDQIADIVIGSDDDVEDGGYTLTVGLAP
jgi:hypothetical protein